MRMYSYIHVMADNQEEYNLLLNLEVPWFPPPSGFLDHIAYTTFLLAPKDIPRLLEIAKRNVSELPQERGTMLELKEAVKALHDLLNDPHPGLATWNEFVNKRISFIARWSGK